MNPHKHPPAANWLGVALLLSLLAGCATARMPPELNEAQQAQIRDKHYACVVGVERLKNFPAYSERLYGALRRTQLFDDVVWTDAGQRYDVIARVEETVYGSPAIPVVCLLTLGIIPSVTDEDHGNVFSLHRVDNRRAKIRVDGKYTGPTVLGWAAGVLSTSPKFTRSPDDRPENSASYDRFLAHRIVTAADAILGPTTQPCACSASASDRSLAR